MTSDNGKENVWEKSLKEVVLAGARRGAVGSWPSWTWLPHYRCIKNKIC